MTLLAGSGWSGERAPAGAAGVRFGHCWRNLRRPVAPTGRPGRGARSSSSCGRGPGRRQGRRRLAYHGRERAAVAFGIALIALDTVSGRPGSAARPGPSRRLHLAAIHTLLATTDSAEATLFAVARVAAGWGRIAAVEALPHPPSPDIQRWLVCGGYDHPVRLPVARRCMEPPSLLAERGTGRRGALSGGDLGSFTS